MSPLVNRKPLSAEAALERLETMCATAEISTGEARRKLFRWGVPPSEVGNIIASLVERRFVDDSRFAGAFARDKAQFANWGKIKIAMQLRQKGITADLIEQALESIDTDKYQDKLRHLICSEINRSPEQYADFAGCQKLARRFIARGFEPALVIAAIKQHRQKRPL